MSTPVVCVVHGASSWLRLPGREQRRLHGSPGDIWTDLCETELGATPHPPTYFQREKKKKKDIAHPAGILTDECELAYGDLISKATQETPIPMQVVYKYFVAVVSNAFLCGALTFCWVSSFTPWLISPKNTAS